MIVDPEQGVTAVNMWEPRQEVLTRSYGKWGGATESIKAGRGTVIFNESISVYNGESILGEACRWALRGTGVMSLPLM